MGTEKPEESAIVGPKRSCSVFSNYPEDTVVVADAKIKPKQVSNAPKKAEVKAVIKDQNTKERQKVGQEIAVEAPQRIGRLKAPSVDSKRELAVSKSNTSAHNGKNLERMEGKGLNKFRTQNNQQLRELIGKGYFSVMKENNLSYRIGKISDRRMAVLLKPVLETHIPALSTEINKYMHSNGLGNNFQVRMVINSAYRTRNYQLNLAGRNSNATRNYSAHESGNTVDIAYNTVDLFNLSTKKFETISGGNLLALYNKALTHVLGGMAMEKQLNVRKEIKQPVYHTSFYFDAKGFKKKIDSSAPKSVAEK